MTRTRSHHLVLRTTAPVLAGLALAATTQVPAQAATTAFDDPTGDSTGWLDVTRVVVHNRDRAVVASVSLVEAQRGTVLVSIDRRGIGRTVATKRYLDGTVRTFLIRGSFADRTYDRARCPGLRAVWDVEAARVDVRMPSSCMHRGDYGAVRASVLTEGPGGGDSDIAPTTDEGDLAWSSWIPRG